MNSSKVAPTSTGPGPGSGPDRLEAGAPPPEPPPPAPPAGPAPAPAGGAGDAGDAGDAVEIVEALTPPVTKYVRFFRHTFDKMVLNGVLFGAVAVVVQICALVATWDRRTSWLRKVPCTFQDQLARFAGLTQVASRTIEFATVLPSIGFVCYGAWYLRASNRTCDDASWRPLRTSTLGLLYCVKILVPVLVYSVINFKLPAYVPYEGMALKACGVTASLAMYPPGRDGSVIRQTYDTLRLAHSNFLSNDANLAYGDVAPGMERALGRLRNVSAGAPVDDTGSCILVGADTTGPLGILNKFLSPPKPITDFCSEAFRVGRDDMGMSLSSALEFPLIVLSRQFSELFAAVPMTYFGCSRPMPPQDGDSARPTPDPSLSFKDLCTAFYSSASFDAVDAKYTPFGVTEERWTRYAAKIAQLDTEEERQWGCALFTGLVDPKTGFDATASQLCPRWVTFQDDASGTWDAIDESLIALKSNPFVGAAAAGFYDGTPKSRRTWQSLAGVVTNVTFSLNYRGAISNRTKTNVGRWSMNDPRALAQLGKDQLIDVMQRLVVLGGQAKTQTFDKVTQSLHELKGQIEASMLETYNALDTSFNAANAGMKTLLKNSTEQGLADILQVVQDQLQLLSYDIQFGVDSDWDLTNNGAQFDNDPCGKGMEGRSGVYPTNQNECESTTQSCFWAAPDNKCGFAQVTPASFRSDVLNSYRYTKTKDDTGARAARHGRERDERVHGRAREHV